MPAWAVRLETKVDIVLTQHGTQLADHEVRLREMQQGLSNLRYVTPAQLWAGIVSSIAGAAGLATLVNWLIGLG